MTNAESQLDGAEEGSRRQWVFTQHCHGIRPRPIPTAWKQREQLWHFITPATNSRMPQWKGILLRFARITFTHRFTRSIELENGFFNWFLFGTMLNWGDFFIGQIRALSDTDVKKRRIGRWTLIFNNFTIINTNIYKDTFYRMFSAPIATQTAILKVNNTPRFTAQSTTDKY
jgi:hypothetical protein